MKNSCFIYKTVNKEREFNRNVNNETMCFKTDGDYRYNHSYQDDYLVFTILEKNMDQYFTCGLIMM